MRKMLEERYEIKSTKYGIDGVVIDFGIGMKLTFVYQTKIIEIGLARPFPSNEITIKQLGMETLDSYIENLVKKEKADRKLQLHYWHIDEKTVQGKMYKMAHGVVSGHNSIQDATYIDTSAVLEIILDKEKEVVLIKTKNSDYQCPLEYCNWRKQDKTSEILTDYEWIKEK